MATVNLIQVKRTSISGRPANTTTLTNPGELALNMPDGILYSTNGTVVFEIGGNVTNHAVSGNIVVGNTTVNTVITGISLKSSNSTSNIALTIPAAADVAAATKFLRVDSTWAVPTAAATPGGANTYVQFNDSGVLNGDPGLQFDKVNDILSLANNITVGNSTVNTSILLTTIKVSNSTATANITPAGFTVGLTVANSTTVVAPTSFIVGNSTINSVSLSTSLKISNSTSNATMTIPTAADWALGTKYLNANGSWTAPAGGSGISLGVVLMTVRGAFTP